MCWRKVQGAVEAAAIPSHNSNDRSAHKVNSIFVIISIIFPFGIIADNLLNDQWRQANRQQSAKNLLAPAARAALAEAQGTGLPACLPCVGPTTVI